MVKKEIINALFYELHKAIKESADNTIENINNPELAYPPGIELTESEKNALRNLNLTEETKSALSKLMVDACSYPCFHLFTLLDGVADPKSEDIGEWYGLSFCNRKDNEEMLHDEFYASYHNVKN